MFESNEQESAAESIPDEDKVDGPLKTKCTVLLKMLTAEIALMLAVLRARTISEPEI
jgi:hypothetical protein